MLSDAMGHKKLCELENETGSVQNGIVKVAEPAQNETLNRIAQRLFWWKTPAEALQDRVRFVAQVMTYGTWDDVQATRAILGEQAFRETLEHPPPGVFDPPSWAYWHHVFSILPVPELPKRTLC